MLQERSDNEQKKKETIKSGNQKQHIESLQDKYGSHVWHKNVFLKSNEAEVNHSTKM